MERVTAFRTTAVVEKDVAAHPEDPRREADLGIVEPRQRTAFAVEVPPAAPVGQEVQLAVRGELRVDHRFLRAARNEPRSPPRPPPQLRAVPRHARMIPCEPDEPPAGRVEARRHEEVVTGGDHARLGRPVRRKKDEFVVHLPRLVPLANADDGRAVGRDRAVRVPQRVWLGRSGRDGPRLLVGDVEPVEASGSAGKRGFASGVVPAARRSRAVPPLERSDAGSRLGPAHAAGSVDGDSAELRPPARATTSEPIAPCQVP